MSQFTLFDPPSGGATLSSDQCYRYLLWRRWDERPPAVFVLLNPSTADGNIDDATVRRCQGYALALGAGGLRIVNLFALRATDPGTLYVTQNPIGSNNDVAICEAVRGAGLVICGWGRHGDYLDRATAVMQMLGRQGVEVKCLRLNKDGSPSHPLYLPANLVPQHFALPSLILT